MASIWDKEVYLKKYDQVTEKCVGSFSPRFEGVRLSVRRVHGTASVPERVVDYQDLKESDHVTDECTEWLAYQRGRFISKI